MSNSKNLQRVLFINPPATSYHCPTPALGKIFEYDHLQNLNYSLPIGMLQVAATIRSLSDTEIFDARLEEAVSVHDGDNIRHGTPPHLIKKKIESYNPTVVAISCYFATQVENSFEMAKIAKQVNSDIKVVMGGPNVTVTWNSLITEDVVDFLVVGEGDESFYELIQLFAEGKKFHEIPGVVSKSNRALKTRELLSQEKLNKLPLPAYDLAHKKYFQKNIWTPVITSRGCPYKCIFCSAHLHMGRKFRPFSSDYVLNNIYMLKHNYNVHQFSFEDDNISMNRIRWHKILDAIISEKLNIQWIIRNGVRADSLDYETLVKMKKAGCESISIAVESGDERVLNNIINKNSSLKKIRETIKTAYDLGIKQSSFYVVGFPGETVAEMRKTINFAEKMFKLYNSMPILFFATPLIGTDLWDECIKEGIINDKCSISPKDWALATSLFGRPMITKTKYFDLDDLMDIKSEFFRIFYKNYLNKILKKLDIFNIISYSVSWILAKKLRRELRKLNFVRN